MKLAQRKRLIGSGRAEPSSASSIGDDDWYRMVRVVLNAVTPKEQAEPQAEIQDIYGDEYVEFRISDAESEPEVEQAEYELVRELMTDMVILQKKIDDNVGLVEIVDEGGNRPGLYITDELSEYYNDVMGVKSDDSLIPLTAFVTGTNGRLEFDYNYEDNDGTSGLLKYDKVGQQLEPINLSLHNEHATSSKRHVSEEWLSTINGYCR